MTTCNLDFPFAASRTETNLLKNLLALLLFVPSLCLAQSVTLLYNPDANSDSAIGAHPLLGLVPMVTAQDTVPRGEFELVSPALCDADVDGRLTVG